MSSWSCEMQEPNYQMLRKCVGETEGKDTRAVLRTPQSACCFPPIIELSAPGTVVDHNLPRHNRDMPFR